MLFEDHYVDWRKTRIEKIKKLYPSEFFKDKTILELGCGLGHIGNEFQQLGAIVTFADGRKKHVLSLREKFPEAEILHLDQDFLWNLNKKFDIIIHWGVLYHLDNWQQDLLCALTHSNLIFLETEVCDSDDSNFEIKVLEHGGWDQSRNGTGSRPSAAMIENQLFLLGASFNRYDDSSINSDFHIYDWEVKNTNEWKHGLRRFWIVTK
jgi:SAM-dependent methyltransferase